MVVAVLLKTLFVIKVEHGERRTWRSKLTPDYLTLAIHETLNEAWLNHEVLCSLFFSFCFLKLINMNQFSTAICGNTWTPSFSSY